MPMKHTGFGYPFNYILGVILLTGLTNVNSLDGYDDQSIKAEFDQIDTSDDGFLTIDEMVDFTLARILAFPNEASRAEETREFLMRTAIEPFNEVDANGDSKLSFEESLVIVNRNRARHG